jgi:hypothetical protein
LGQASLKLEAVTGLATQLSRERELQAHLGGEVTITLLPYPDQYDLTFSDQDETHWTALVMLHGNHSK